MPSTARLAIEEQSQTAQVRRAAVRLAEESGFSEARSAQIGIAVTEACTNILKHAGSGEVLLQLTDPGDPESNVELEMLAIDRGPGMDNLDQCMRDGYSTGGSRGEGLGAIQRLSDRSDFYSVRGEGTVVLARWARSRADAGTSFSHNLRISGISVPKPGQEICGDSWGVEQNGSISTVMVADGLGHGYDASLASVEAVRMLRDHRDMAPGRLIDVTHAALRSLRGAAVSIARIDVSESSVTFSGLGNVSAQIFSTGGHSQHLVSINGTAGHHAATIREFKYQWPNGGVLVMHSDGLATNATLEGHAALAARDPSVIAAVLYRDFVRGNDDATVVVAKV